MTYMINILILAVIGCTILSCETQNANSGQVKQALCSEELDRALLMQSVQVMKSNMVRMDSIFEANTNDTSFMYLSFEFGGVLNYIDALCKNVNNELGVSNDSSDIYSLDELSQDVIFDRHAVELILLGEDFQDPIAGAYTANELKYILHEFINSVVLMDSSHVITAKFFNSIAPKRFLNVSGYHLPWEYRYANLPYSHFLMDMVDLKIKIQNLYFQIVDIRECIKLTDPTTAS